MCFNKLEANICLWRSFFHKFILSSFQTGLFGPWEEGGGVCVRTYRTLPPLAYAPVNTNVVRRNCAERNSNVVTKVVETRRKFGRAKAELVEQKGSTSFKRMCRPEITRESSTFQSVVGNDGAYQPQKRRLRTSLFQDSASRQESTIRIPTHRESCTQMTHWPEQTEAAGAVYVSNKIFSNLGFHNIHAFFKNKNQ